LPSPTLVTKNVISAGLGRDEPAPAQLTSNTAQPATVPALRIALTITLSFALN
jgi:hypothetical protein